MLHYKYDLESVIKMYLKFFSFPLFTTVHKICIGILTPNDLIPQIKSNPHK